MFLLAKKKKKKKILIRVYVYKRNTHVRGPGLPGTEAVKKFQYLVLGVRGQRVPAPVHGDAGASRKVVVEPDVGGPRMVKLNVPVAERRYLAFDFVAERYLRERRAVRRRRPHREQLRPCGVRKENG